MADCKSGHTFKNWARTLEFKPRQFCKPKTEARIVEVVREARNRKGCVRTQGAGHSFSQLRPTNDTLVSLDDMDHSTMRISGTEATVSAGIRLKDLIRASPARTWRSGTWGRSPSSRSQARPPLELTAPASPSGASRPR